jgi:hypothetical protein
MADTLTQALTGLNVAPSETPWGIGAMSLAQSSPLLMNPYSSWQQNLAIGLGANLVAGLLGYQARQSAMEQNLALQPYITQALKAPNMESLDTILAQEDAAPLRGLGAQLKMNILQRQAAATERQQNLRDSLFVAAIKEGYIPKSLQTEYGTMMGGLGSGGLTPRQQQELDLYERQQKIKEEIEAPGRNATMKWQKDQAGISFANQFQQNPVVKEYDKITRFNETIAELAKNPTRPSIDQLITLSKKTVDPDSAVVLGEFAQTVDQQSAVQKLKAFISNLSSATPRIDPQIITEIAQASQVVADMMGQTYNRQLDATLKQARASGLEDFNVEKLGRTYYGQQGTVGTSFDDPKVIRMREIKAELQSGITDPQRIRALQIEAQGIYQGGQSGR